MKFRQYKIIILGSFCIAILLMASTFGYLLISRNIILEQNHSKLESESRVLHEFFSNTIKGISNVLDVSSGEVVRKLNEMDRPSLMRKLADLSAGARGLTTLFVLAPDGRQILNSRIYPPPDMSSADRAYFTEALASGDERTLMSATLKSRVLGTWQFYASRPVRGPDNSDIAVICAAIDTTLFQDVLASYQPDPDMEAALFTSDLEMIARSPPDPRQFGLNFADAPVFRTWHARHSALAYLIAPGFGGAAERMTIIRQVADLPLVLTVSVPTDVILAQWCAHAGVLLSATGMLSAFIIFAGFAGARGVRKQAEAATLLDTIFTQMPACIAIADATGSIIKCNENWIVFDELFDVPGDAKGDVIKSLRHKVHRSGDNGLTKGRKKALNDINAVTAGAKGNAVLELRCIREGIDRYFTVNITRIILAADPETEGFAVLVVDISKQRVLELRLRSQLTVDSQTGLANREGLISALGAALPKAVEDDCLFVFDIVGLSELKEIRGMKVSDEAFSAVGAKLSALAEQSCIVGRVDSGKFCVFMPGHAHGAAATERLQALVDHVAHEYSLNGHTFNVRMTTGGARVGDAGRDPEKLIQAAEIAHGLAKRRGAASSAFFNAKIEADARERVRLYESLQKSLAEKEFALEFQPKVELGSGAVIGAEALIRWHHPTFGVQPPSSFIPIAEESGLIVPIGEWVMEEVMRVLGSWPEEGEGPVPISINVSVAQFDRQEVDRMLSDHLERHGVRPELVTIELTESVFSLQPEETLAKINRIREMGVRVSLDDFGIGYSSLSYLHLMNFDELKVDGSFVRKIATDVVSRSIVEMTLSLARTLNASVTAEGVETEAQREALMAMGCSAAQGFLFSKSLTAPELRALVREHRRLLPRPLLQSAVRSD